MKTNELLKAAAFFALGWFAKKNETKISETAGKVINWAKTKLGKNTDPVENGE